MRQASSKRDCLSVCPSVCMYVCHTFLHICKVHTCDVIMYLLAHHSALRSCLFSKYIFDSLKFFSLQLCQSVWEGFNHAEPWWVPTSFWRKDQKPVRRKRTQYCAHFSNNFQRHRQKIDGDLDFLWWEENLERLPTLESLRVVLNITKCTKKATKEGNFVAVPK